MNKLSNIHYAVKIQTAGTLTDQSIGLEGGVFRYITDKYAPITDVDENNVQIEGTWYTEFLAIDGIKTSSQTIDIITGGDYSYISGLQIDLTNYNQLHKKMLTSNDLYLVGSVMTLYVIIDGVWYSRWVGSVSEYNFSEDSFTFIGKDINNQDNTTVSNFIFGYNNTVFIPVETEENPFIGRLFIKNYEPVGRGTTPYAQEYIPYFPPIELVDPTFLAAVDEYYCTSHMVSKYQINLGDKQYHLRTNGHRNDISKGMYVLIDNDTTLHYISDVSYKNEVITDGTTKDFTELTIMESTESIIGYDNFYGHQPLGVSNEIKNNTKKYDKDTVLFNVYNKGLHFPAISGGYDVINGKIRVTTKDGTVLHIDVSENSDGSLTVMKTTYSTIVKPKSIKYWSDQGDLATKLDNSEAANLEQYGSSVSIPNDLDSDGTFEPTNRDKYHYFMLEFDDVIDDLKPFVLVNALIDNREDWTHGGLNFEYSQLLPVLHTKDQVGSSTVYRNPRIASDVDNVNSMFRVFELNCYKIAEDRDFGLVPLFDDGSSFNLPNTRYRGQNYTRDKWNIIVDSKSAPVSNLPGTEFQSKCISTYNGIVDFEIQAETALSTTYPIGKVTAITGNSNITSGKHLLIRVQATNDIPQDVIGTPPGEYNSDFLTVFNEIQGVVHTINLNSFQFGVNSMGVSKITEITSISDVAIATHDEKIDTYPELLGNLSNTIVDLPSRDTWFVGGNIQNDTNKFNVVSTLCKQGYVGGYTDRFGRVKFRDILEYADLHSHDDTNIIRGSLKDFKLSPIDKCYNEFTIKYNRVFDEYTKTLGVYHVDEDSFPLPTDVDPTWGAPIDILNGAVYYKRDGFPNRDYVIQINLFDPMYQHLVDNPYDLYKLGLYDPFSQGLEFVFSNVTFAGFNSITADIVYFYVDRISGIEYTVPNSGVGANKLYLNQNDNGFLWKTFVVGVESYPDAKDLWEAAHGSYKLNRRIRVAPNERTVLEYAVDLNSFYGFTDADPDQEYAFNYFKMLVAYTTKQKLQVSYKLPLTSDSVRLEILDSVMFNDPIITPGVGEFGEGLITGIKYDPRSCTIDITLTFDPVFFIPPALAVQCVNIRETGSSDVDIWESGSNEDDIIEGNC